MGYFANDEFVHLHSHTEFSLLDGSNKIKEYVKRVKELGMTCAAITDHGVMYGVIDFYKCCRAEGIKPIIGCEVYVAPGSRFDKEAGLRENSAERYKDDRYYHLILLAENNTGYANLCKIVSKGFTEGFYYKPRVDVEVLREYHEGIIALTACLAGEIPKLITRGDTENAVEKIKEYRDIFGEDNFFLELQDHGIWQQANVNAALLGISSELGIPVVATNDVHYTYKEDVESHDILLCIQTGSKVSDENRMRYEGGQFYVKSTQEMGELFGYVPEAIKNTHLIAERCNVDIEFGKTKLPHFDVPKGHTSWTYLNFLCRQGLEKRYPRDNGSILKRLEYELSVIERMGYVDYFLIVWDFINYARENNIPVGPGRGSAAGSVVSYCLYITNIDPIKYQLLFERFLNPDRVSMPDIDIDFCFERRQEVIDYVSSKYGKDKVVQIVTFGTLAAKGVIKDVGRALDLPYSYTDSISRMIPAELNITIDRALEINAELRNKYETDTTLKYLIDISKRLEGLPRHTSMHAAGVVICPESADHFVPLSRGSDGSVTTQFTMTTLEELGLLKMDFLGLRTLTVIKSAVDNIRKSKGRNINIDEIDYDEEDVLNYIGTGKTDGIFQLESGGMKNLMKEIKPKALEDIIAGISLFRPGPMDFIPQYIKGKNSGEEVTYICPQLESILSPTYGCMVYQEQVMQIVRELAGYSMGEADNIRRAMSKKKQEVIDRGRDDFVHGNRTKQIKGCVPSGISEEAANRIYDSMTDFGRYAFNKSHAACYAVVAYQTAWLKYHYPEEFMAALMTSVIDNNAKVSEYILSCRGMGIAILPPDINQGEIGFTVKPADQSGKGGIVYALTAIKGAGRILVERITGERHKNGPYSGIDDFIRRNFDGDLNKRIVENLIKAGAFDTLGGTRRQYMTIYMDIFDRLQSEQRDSKKNVDGQMSLFEFIEEDKEAVKENVTLPNVGEFGKDLLLAFEKEVLGVYVSGHPLEQYMDIWKNNITRKSSDLFYRDDSGKMIASDGENATMGGIIAEKNIKYTKKDQPMAFITLEDLTGSVECIVFPQTYQKYAELLKVDEKILVKGRIDAGDEQDGKLLAEAIIPFEDIPRKVWIQFPTIGDYEAASEELKNIIKPFDGKDSIVIYISEGRMKKELGKNMTVNSQGNLIHILTERFGNDNVRVR